MGSNDRQELAIRLAPVADLRRAQAPLRVLIAVMIGVFFVWGRDNVPMALWLGAYAAAQGLEVWALWPFRAGRPVASRRRAHLALASITLLAASVAALSLFLWRLPGSLGPAAAVLLLCQGALNVLSTSRGCRPAFTAGVLPYAGMALALPFSWSVRGAEATQPAFLLAVTAFVATLLVIWRDGERLNTSERRALADLDSRRREAEAAGDARAAFTAAVSHELRTPLSAILAAASALEVRALTAQNRESAHMIGDASRMMRRLLDDLLDFSKLEAGRMAVEDADLDLGALVDETLRLWGPEAAAKGLELSVHGRETLPPFVRGDGLRLRQVLNNLVSNALKFTDRGGVRLEFDAKPGGGGWMLRIAVADTGAGLDQAAIDRLFRPFEQVSASVARTHGGTGLGLAISRELARLMGGDLRAERRADAHGSRFVLHLPVAAGHPTGGRPEPLARVARQEPRVLVVDDHPLGRQAVGMLLGLHGCEVRLCDSGGEALAILAETPYDLVLTDLHLGDLDGRELARRLRGAAGPNRAAPLLAVSGETGPDALASCLAAGMDGLAPKPLEPRTLYAAVDAALAAAGAVASNDAESLALSADSSFSSHSQTISTVQPPACNAA